MTSSTRAGAMWPVIGVPILASLLSLRRLDLIAGTP